jgi:hypothetical protein
VNAEAMVQARAGPKPKNRAMQTMQRKNGLTEIGLVASKPGKTAPKPIGRITPIRYASANFMRLDITLVQISTYIMSQRLDS